MLIKATALYCLWVQTTPDSQEGQLERIKTTSKIACELQAEECDDAEEEILEAAKISINEWEALEKTSLSPSDLDEVCFSVSHGFEMLLRLMRGGNEDNEEEEEQQQKHKQKQKQPLPLENAQEISRRATALLALADLRPRLLLLRALTVCSDVASYLVKHKSFRSAKDVIVACLQAIEDASSSSSSSSSFSGRPSSLISQRQIMVHRRCLLFLLSDCWANLQDIDKALTCLSQLEILQKESPEDKSAGSNIDSGKIQLAKISCILRSSTVEGVQAARSIILCLCECGDLESSLSGCRAMLHAQAFDASAFDVYEELLDRLSKATAAGGGATACLSRVVMDYAGIIEVAIKAASTNMQRGLLIARLIKILTPDMTLSQKERAKLCQVTKQAIWSNNKSAEQGGDQGQVWGYTSALCDILLKLTPMEDKLDKELAMITKSHALLQQGHTQDALQIAKEVNDLTRTERSRANLFWISASAASPDSTEDPVLLVLKGLLNSPQSGRNNREALLDSLLCLATMVAQTLSETPQYQSRLLKVRYQQPYI